MKTPTLIFLFFCGPALSGGAGGLYEAPKVELKEQGRLYSVTASFKIEADLSSVWDVLTDYGGLKGIVSSLKESTVLERQGNAALVEQEAVGSFLFFKRAIPLRLKITEQPHTAIEFEEVTGRVFQHYRGGWTLKPGQGEVEVLYRLDVSKNAVAPPFIERGLFRAQSLALLRELREEIICRRSPLK